MGHAHRMDCDGHYRDQMSYAGIPRKQQYWHHNQGGSSTGWLITPESAYLDAHPG